MFSGLYHHVIWWKFKNISENLAISVIRVDESTAMMRQHVSLISLYVSTKLHGVKIQTTAIFNIITFQKCYFSVLVDTGKIYAEGSFS